MIEDEPGVNWMLYLPQVLTAQQVPEAAALVAVDVYRTVRTNGVH